MFIFEQSEAYVPGLRYNNMQVDKEREDNDDDLTLLPCLPSAINL